MAKEDITRYLRDNAQFPREVLIRQPRDAGYAEANIAAATAELDGGRDSGVSVPPGPAEPEPMATGGKLPGPFALFREAWTMYTAKWKLFLAITLLPYATIFGVALVMVPIIGSFLGASVLEDTVAASFLNWFGAIGLLIIVVIGLPALLTVQFWGIAALWYTATRGTEPLTFRQAFGATRKLILPFFWVSLLTAGVIYGGFVLFIVPAFIFSVWFSFSTYVLFVDGDRGMSALFKSREYVRGRAWAVAGRLVAFYLMGLGVFIILAVVGAILSSALGDGAEWLETLARWAVNIAWVPLSVLYGYVLFRHVKAAQGDVTPVVTGGRKARYIALIALGALTVLIVPLLLSFVVLTSLDSARDQARDIKRLADLDTMRLSLEVYASQNGGVYPDVPGAPGGGPTAETFVALADALVNAQLLSARPVDPSEDREYVAQVDTSSNATSYILGADLETDQLACDTDYDAADLEEPDTEPIAICSETVSDDCSGDEPDGVDYCICQGQACG